MSWQERFNDSVKTCKSNSENLQSLTCKDSQNLVLQGYNDYYREAKGDLDAYTNLVDERGMSPRLNLEIENKIKHYNDSCNGLYPMYEKLFRYECVSVEKTVSKTLIIFGVIGLAVLLFVIGFFVKDSLMKKILWGLGALIVLLVGVYFIHQIFFAKKKIHFVPYF